MCIRDRYDLVAAAGGDGTVNEVVNGLVGEGERASLPLGIIPIGSGNDLAFGLGIREAPEEAVARIFTGQRRPLDLARVTDDRGQSRVFQNNLGIGFDAVSYTHLDVYKRQEPIDAPEQSRPPVDDAVDDLTTLLALAQRTGLHPDQLPDLRGLLMNPDRDRRSLLLTLATEMSLLRRTDERLRPTRAALDWLQRSREAQLRALVDAWSRSVWNELRHTPGLVAEGCLLYTSLSALARSYSSEIALKRCTTNGLLRRPPDLFILLAPTTQPTQGDVVDRGKDADGVAGDDFGLLLRRPLIDVVGPGDAAEDDAAVNRHFHPRPLQDFQLETNLVQRGRQRRPGGGGGGHAAGIVAAGADDRLLRAIDDHTRLARGGGCRRGRGRGAGHVGDHVAHGVADLLHRVLAAAAAEQDGNRCV